MPGRKSKDSIGSKAIAVFLSVTLILAILPVMALGQGSPSEERSGETAVTTQEAQSPESGAAADPATTPATTPATEPATEPAPEPAPVATYMVTFQLPTGYTFADGTSSWSLAVNEGQAVPFEQIPNMAPAGTAEKPFKGWQLDTNTQGALAGSEISALLPREAQAQPVLSAEEIAAKAVAGSLVYRAVFGDSLALMANDPISLFAFDWQTTGAGARLGTASGNFRVVSPDGVATGYSSLSAATGYLKTVTGGGTWLLYVGASVTASGTEFQGMNGVSTLVITGKTDDPLAATPQPASSASNAGSITLTFAANTHLGINLQLRNIRYNAGSGGNLYANGHSLTLGHLSWATAATNYFGGAASGNTTGNPSLTVYSTGTGASEFVGGMRAGTLTGNTAISITGTSGNTISVYGAGLGTSSSQAHLVGTTNTTITGMATNANGLKTFVGGSAYGNVTGPIRNTIYGSGRWNSNAADNFRTSLTSGNKFVGGSASGTVGTAGNTADVIINRVNTSTWVDGQAYYLGTTLLEGTIYGNVVNVISAGSYHKGSYVGVTATSGYMTAPSSNTWNTSSNWGVRATGSGDNWSELFIDTPQRAISAAESAMKYRHYGNATTEVKKGCIGNGWDWNNHYRGAGYGFFKGNAVSDIGTEGLVYSGDQASGFRYTLSTNNSSGAQQGSRAALELAGGGGHPWELDEGLRSIMIVGNTTLNVHNAYALWTYGASYGGSMVGDSKYVMYGGLADTVEGSGNEMYVQIGNSFSEIHGGQVDWFLSGGGWNNRYKLGEATVTVFDSDNPYGNPVYINALMGGMYGDKVQKGDAHVVVYGGHFEGRNRYNHTGFSGGASGDGTILGDTYVTLDLRGNKNGFTVSRNDSVTAGRANHLDYTPNYLGYPDGRNSMTVNIYTDANSKANLNGINIYGDAHTSNTSYTRSSKININVNAPGGDIGEIYATRYDMTTSTQLTKDVKLNIVSARSIGGLSMTDSSSNINNSLAGTTTKKAVLYVGPQPEPAGWDSRPVNEGGNGMWPLTDLEPGLGPDGFPRRINVTGSVGVVNFTSATIDQRLLVATSGSIKNGKNATTANHYNTYNNFGDILLKNNAGLGSTAGSGVFIAGKLNVEGQGYVASTGARNQIVLSDVNFTGQQSPNRLVWLKEGSTGISNLSPVSSWFGASQGYPVITLNSGTGGAGRTNAQKFTPGNFTGQETSTGKTFIGDSEIPTSGDNGYGVCIPGNYYSWNVVPGADNSSLGKITAHMEGNFNKGSAKPGTGYLDVYTSSPLDTPTTSGTMAIPTAKIPNPVGYPKFTFTPDAPTGEWVKYLTVQRSDHYVANPVGAGDYTEGEQSQDDYNNAANRERSWQSGQRNTNDKEYSFDIEVDYTSAPELTATGYILREREAQALVYNNVPALPAAYDPSGYAQKTELEVIAGVLSATSAKGRPFFTHDINAASAVAALGTPLATGESSRDYQVRYATHASNGGAETLQKTVTITVVPDDTIIAPDGKAALTAVSATMQVPQAQAIVAQNVAGGNPAALNNTHLDWWTGARVILVSDAGTTTIYANLSDAAAKVSAIQGTATKSSLPLSYNYDYSYTDAQGAAQTVTLSKDVVAYVLGGSFSGVLWEDLNGDGVLDANETERFGNKTVQLYLSNGTLLATTTTAADGSYNFGGNFADAYAINEGSYYVKFPDLSPRGITAPYNHSRKTVDQVISWSANYSYLNNAGYKTPGGVDTLEASLSKRVWNGSAFETGRTITNSQTVLEYRIQFTLPADITGYESLRINDILPAGLVYASAEADPFVVRVGGTSASTGTAYTLDPAQFVSESGRVSYLLTNFSGLAGQTINVYIKAKLEKVGGTYPAEITNKAQLVLNAGEASTGLGGTLMDGPTIKDGATISGTLWYDANGDGVKDAGEFTVGGGKTVTLYAAADTSFAAPLATATTNPDGAYSFTRKSDGTPILAGSYVVTYPVIIDYSFVLGNGAGGTSNVAVRTGVSNTLTSDLNANQNITVNAGYKRAPGIDPSDPDAFTKKLVDSTGTPLAGNQTTVTNPASEIVNYQISVKMPSDMVPFGGIEIRDLMGTDLQLSGSANDVTVTVTKAGVPVSGLTPVKTWDSATGTLKLSFEGTYAAVMSKLEDATVVIGVAATVKASSGTYPTQAVNNAQVYLNGAQNIEIPANARPVVNVKGVISGTLFTDANRNGFYDTGDTYQSAKTVTLYAAGDLATALTTTTTDANGAYRFEVVAGSYVVKAPAISGYGYTTLVAAGNRTAGTTYNDVGNNGTSGTLVIDLTNDGANLAKTANAGYAQPTPNTDPGAFAKDLVAVNGVATTGPIHDSTADLSYKISYLMPTNTAGYNRIELLDIMDAGLVLKDAATTNIAVTAADASNNAIAVNGTASYAAGAGALANKMLASFVFDPDTDFSTLAGATLTMTITARLAQVSGNWPTTVTNTARLVVNNGDTPTVPDVPNTESNNGLISGFAFTDANRNGTFDNGEALLPGVAVILKQWDGSAYAAYTPQAGDIATTDAQGAYKFEVPAGQYRVEFPTPLSGAGITTSGSGYAPLSGIVEGIVIELGTSATQTRTISVGYNTPDPTVIGDIKNSFSKLVNDGTGTYVDSRTVTNVAEVLDYKISFTVPTAPAGNNGAFAGFSSLKLTDVLEEGLAFATVTAPAWNYQVLVGSTVVFEGIATGASLEHTLDAAAIGQYLANASAGTEVALMVKANMVQVAGNWPTTLTNHGYLTINGAGAPDAQKDLELNALGQGPAITFTQYPLVINQTPLANHIMTADELKAALEVTDAEDYPVWAANWTNDNQQGLGKKLYDTMVVTPLDSANRATTINTANIGVYKVRYTAKDSTGNETTEYRAVVVNDGRYIIEDEDGDGKNDVIIGARNFIIQQSAVQRLESHIQGLSYAEAFDTEGNALAVALTPADDAGIPAGYTTGNAPKGTYNFVWKAAGFNTTKTITGEVVIADVIDPGTKDSQYAIYASHFMVNTAEAAVIRDTDNFVSVADAHVVKLVASAPDKLIRINDRGTPPFTDVQATYPITFAIGDIPISSQKATINGVVTNGKPPTLAVSSPVNIWVGAAADKPAGAIDASAYTSIMYNVSATDPDGGGKNPDVPQDITSSVVATPDGPAVDTTKVGTYTVHFSVTDADNNTVVTDRLIVVNDGRYTVGAGRVLYAKPFVILKSVAALSTTDAAKTQLIRDNSKPKLIAGSNETTTIHAGSVLPPDLITLASLGGFDAVQGTYSPIFNGVDYPTGTIARTIKAKVVDAGVIESGPDDENKDTYYIYGNNIELTPVAADAIQLDTVNGLEKALLTALGAGADKTDALGTLSSVGVKVTNYDGFNTRSTGTLANGVYHVVISDADNNITATLTVTVASGNPPVLSVTPKPLVIQKTDTAGTVTNAKLMEGVSATDVEDDAAGTALNITIKGGTPTIPTDVFSVTKVTYTVTDSAGNTTEASRAVVIDDGTIVYNERYILRAKSFMIHKDLVSSTNREDQIKDLSDSAAWDSDGNAIVRTRISVPDLGGYQAAVADYTGVKLSLQADPTLVRNITAKVFGDGTGGNGDDYSILAKDFVINVPDANVLAADLPAAIQSQFVTRAGVETYKRSGNFNFQEGTPELVSAIIQGGTASFASRAGSLAEGNKFDVIFWVGEDHTATVKVTLTISNRNAPTLTVLSPKVVPWNDPFDEGAFADTTPSYLQGVSANDSEDGAYNQATLASDKPGYITHDTPVDTSVDKAIYTVTYSVTDSDHNTTTKPGAVLVGEWEVADGYGITADGFSKEIGDLLGKTDAQLAADILTFSLAKGVDLRQELSAGVANPAFGSEVAVKVLDDGGYYTKTPGDYQVILQVVASPTTTKTIAVHVGQGSGPAITFTELPLVIDQTPRAPHTLTSEELKAALQVTDAEDYPVWAANWTNDNQQGLGKRLYDTMQVTPLNEAGQPTTIDTANIGVYKVRYVAKDATGNETTEYRAVVITDGRYIIEDEDKDNKNDIIIGARNFVIQQAAVQRLESHIKGLSYAEAFDVEGTALSVALVQTSQTLTDGIPAGYTTHSAAAGDYPFVWKAAGHSTTKPISGKVVVADELDPGTKDSQYALYASHFKANTVQAQAIIDGDPATFIAAAHATVVQLVPSAPVAAVAVIDRGTPPFAAAQGSYPISFAIAGIPPTVQKAVINGVVSNGDAPALDVETPVNVWISTAAAPAGAITAAQYSAVANNMYGVNATDTEDGNITSRVVATATGAAVDLTKAGLYTVHYSVEDSDHNVTSTDRLVVVNDGRYTVGAGRVLYAASFIVTADRVATTDAGKLTQVRAETVAKLVAGSNESASVRAGDVLPSDQIVYRSLGGYSSTVGTYDITIGAVDYPATAPALVRTVKAEVVPADEIIVGPQEEKEDRYAVYGNNITVTISEADALQTGTQAEQQQKILTALGASARFIAASGSITPVTAVVADSSQFLSRTQGTLGTFAVKVTDEGAHAELILTIRVVTGAAPVISATPAPLVIDLSQTPGTVSADKLMEGVSATDVEDGPLTPTIKGQAPQIATNTVSVTQVTYTVTDSDGNTTEASRAVIVNDGSVVYNGNYILQARSFVIKLGEVSKTDPTAQIKTLSEAKAWTSGGVALHPSRIFVADDGGYQAAIANYGIELTLADDPTLTRSITAKVYANKDGQNGATYSILAADFIINTHDANALAPADIAATFISRAGAESYKRSGGLYFQEGTKALVSAVAQTGGATFASRIGQLVEGDKFNVTFWVDEDHTATVTVVLTVSNRNKPILTVPTKVVPLGAAFTEGAYADATASYMQGVYGYDSEDGTYDQASLTPGAPGYITHDNTVNTAIDKSAWIVTYTITDTDHNTVQARGVVLVGEWDITPDGFAITADNFRKPRSEVVGTQAEVLVESKAKGVDLRQTLADGSPNPNFGLQTALMVADFGGYNNRVDGVFTIVIAVTEAPTSTKSITALVDDNRLTVTYFANGGVGTPPATTVHNPGTQAVVSDQAGLTRAGYTFGGWFSGNNGATYQPGNTVTVDENTRLYAVWTPVPVPPVQQPPIVVVQPPVVIQTPGENTVTEVQVPYQVPAPTQPPAQEIVDAPTPLAQAQGTWSLLSLILAALIFVMALAAALFNLRKKDDEDDDDPLDEQGQNRRRNLRILNVIVAVLGLAPAVVFLLLDKITNTMAITNQNTIFVAIAALVELALVVTCLALSRTRTEDDVDAEGLAVS